MSQTPQKIGLILTGGRRTRWLYQVGVLKAIAEMMPRRARTSFHTVNPAFAHKKRVLH